MATKNYHYSNNQQVQGLQQQQHQQQYQQHSQQQQQQLQQHHMNRYSDEAEYSDSSESNSGDLRDDYAYIQSSNDSQNVMMTSHTPPLPPLPPPYFPFKNEDRGIPAINNRYSDSDVIYTDADIEDFKQNTAYQQQQKQQQPLPQEHFRAQDNANFLASSNNNRGPRNYLIFQPHPTFDKTMNVASMAANNWAQQSNEDQTSSMCDESNQMQQSDTVPAAAGVTGDSFTNHHHPGMKSVKRGRLMAFMKAADNWRQDSNVLESLISEKLSEVMNFYARQSERTTAFFSRLEDSLRVERDSILSTLQQSQQASLNQIASVQRQLLAMQQHCLELQEDVAPNVDAIVEDMRCDAFEGILHSYSCKLHELDSFAKKNSVCLNLNLIDVQLSNNATYLLKHHVINKSVSLHSAIHNVMKGPPAKAHFTKDQSLPLHLQQSMTPHSHGHHHQTTYTHNNSSSHYLPPHQTVSSQTLPSSTHTKRSQSISHSITSVPTAAAASASVLIASSGTNKTQQMRKNSSITSTQAAAAAATSSACITQKKRTNSVYTSLLKNIHNPKQSSVPTLGNQHNHITSVSATHASQKRFDFDPANRENINLINIMQQQQPSRFS